MYGIRIPNPGPFCKETLDEEGECLSVWGSAITFCFSPVIFIQKQLFPPLKWMDGWMYAQFCSLRSCMSNYNEHSPYIFTLKWLKPQKVCLAICIISQYPIAIREKLILCWIVSMAIYVLGPT